MLLESLCSIAVYCPRCGRVEIQDIPVFENGRRVLYCKNCGNALVSWEVRPRKGLLLSLTCGLCGAAIEKTFSLHQLHKIRFEKLYCEKDHFELGYIGRWQDIAEFIDFNAAEYDALHPGEEADALEHQQALLEAVNRAHERILLGDLACPCGSTAITVGIVGDSVLLECTDCGSSCLLPARTGKDLQRILRGDARNFPWKRELPLDMLRK